ncbi:tetraspanin-10-like isoform X2 [Cucurbita moschata]|uniref:Tetraspanin-10-like isoform X2 n=1 Tax=Cucurbita moschata TaxID=3662 RepID=A0A6J1EQ67_CUCMO|nr:tetraspanin-10-like isoform X2 [Cucurbita moschata]
MPLPLFHYPYSTPPPHSSRFSLLAVQVPLPQLSSEETPFFLFFIFCPFWPCLSLFLGVALGIRRFKGRGAKWEWELASLSSDGSIFSPWFIVTNNGSGHSVAGLRYKEYQLQDYSTWFLKQLNNTDNWMHLRSCLVKSEDCNNLSKRYKTLKQYKLAKLTPIEAGCCRPPSECGYPAVNASYYDLSFHPVDSNHDCKLYKNSKAVKCYDCDSCKAGVAQYMKTEWRLVAIFNVVLFVVLLIIYLVGCCARRKAATNRSKG